MPLKIYSVHEPHVNCISKGGWFVGAKALPGNPYDGHTLGKAIEQVERIISVPEHAFVNMGYRGHDYEGGCEIHVDKRRRGATPKSLWKWMKRCAAIEPGIGHLKQEHRMDRCRLKGTEDDEFNVVLSAAEMNFGKLLKAVSLFPSHLRMFFEHLIRQVIGALRLLRLDPTFPDRPDQIIALG